MNEASRKELARSLGFLLDLADTEPAQALRDHLKTCETCSAWRLEWCPAGEVLAQRVGATALGAMLTGGVDEGGG